MISSRPSFFDSHAPHAQPRRKISGFTSTLYLTLCIAMITRLLSDCISGDDRESSNSAVKFILNLTFIIVLLKGFATPLLSKKISEMLGYLAGAILDGDNIFNGRSNTGRIAIIAIAGLLATHSATSETNEERKTIGHIP